MCLFYILSRFYFSQELCWRLTTRMIAVFIIMYSITNMVFSLPNLFQLCSEWRHHSCQMAIMSALCSFTLELSTASILLTPVTKQQEKNQAERNKGGNLRPQNRENKPGQGEQAGVVQTCTSTSSLSPHVGRPLRHRATSWASEEGVASLSLLSLHCMGHPKSRLSPRAPRSWSRSWMTIWHWPLAVLELPLSLLCLWVSSRFCFHIFSEYITTRFFPALASCCIGLWRMLTNMTDRLPVYTESKLDSKITLNSPPLQTPTTPGTTASPWRTTEQDFLI